MLPFYPPYTLATKTADGKDSLAGGVQHHFDADALAEYHMSCHFFFARRVSHPSDATVHRPRRSKKSNALRTPSTGHSNVWVCVHKGISEGRVAVSLRIIRWTDDGGEDG